MRQIAATGGGYALAPGDVSGLPERLHAAEQSKQRKTEPRTAWDRPWVLASLFLLLAAEWWIRRRSGMA